MVKYLVVILLLLFQASLFAKDIVNYSWYREGRQQLKYDLYYQELLALALEKSVDKFGEYELNKVDAGMSQDHMIELARRDKLVNLMWTMTSRVREEKLIPIRIPLLKGLGGCRIALIKQGDQEKFNQLTSIQKLKDLYAGQGSMWPDTQILTANGFNVITAHEHITLYPMLEKGRFDYFPRAIHEALSEVKQHKRLSIEQRFVISYDSPFFFFVNKQNPRLAKRIEYGLSKAIEDGSFDAFFNTNKVTSGVINAANLSNREVIRLENPLLTEATKQALAALNHQSSCAGN